MSTPTEVSEAATASVTPAPNTMDAAAFRARLLDAGLLVDLQVDGLYARSAEFEDVVDALDRLVGRRAGPTSSRSLRFPPVMARSSFEQTGFVRSFPDLAGAVSTFGGGDAQHRALISELEDGGEWTAALAPSDVVLASSACHPLYAGYSGRLDSDAVVVDLLGWCFRHEPALDPGRMQSFRQREVVLLGAPDAAVEHRDHWVSAALEIALSLGLAAHSEVANDPFFGRAGRLLASGQREAELKIEIVVAVGSADPVTAIASSNCHQDHFGHAFGITMPDGATAHSSCVGFGLERLTLALLREHGLVTAQWPPDVRAVLWP